MAAWGMDFQPYVYASNNPVVNTDPSGMVSCPIRIDGQCQSYWNHPSPDAPDIDGCSKAHPCSPTTTTTPPPGGNGGNGNNGSTNTPSPCAEILLSLCIDHPGVLWGGIAAIVGALAATVAIAAGVTYAASQLATAGFWVKPFAQTVFDIAVWALKKFLGTLISVIATAGQAVVGAVRHAPTWLKALLDVAVIVGGLVSAYTIIAASMDLKRLIQTIKMGKTFTERAGYLFGAMYKAEHGGGPLGEKLLPMANEASTIAGNLIGFPLVGIAVGQLIDDLSGN